MTTSTLNVGRSASFCARHNTRLPGFVWSLLVLMLCGFAAIAAPPVMTLPSTVTIPEDEATNLVFSVSDADSPLYTVTITAKSSNTDLVPNSGLAVSGAGSTRFLAITPGLHKYGSTTITLVATDDNQEKSTNSFTLNVTYTNYPPTFTAVPGNRTIREDAGSTNLTFSISDVETALSNLTITATSTNTTLVPNGNLVLSGTTANRTLNLTTATNLHGTTRISIVVTDEGGAAVTNDFVITVLPVNDAPTFTISTNRIELVEDAGLTTISNFLSEISSGPANESSQSNWLVLNYSTNFFAQAPTVDSNGHLTFQVATNAYGTNAISFILVDDGGTENGGRDRSTNILTLAVASVNDLPVFLTDISDLTINEDAGRTNLNFSIFDADHSLSSLKVIATSTNTSLVPTNGFTFTGNSTNRTLGITAATNAFGTTEISLVITDPAGGSVTNTFVLTVNPVPDAPILAGTTNRTFLEDASGPLTGVISLYDADTEITNVSFTVSSSNTNVVGVAITETNTTSVNSRAFTVEYLLQTNASGSATISVVANDGTVAVTNNYTVTVTPVNDVPSFALSTNLVLIAEDAGAISLADFATGISVGPDNETNQTYTFTVKSEANFPYTTAPTINAAGTLAFRVATNAFGTNVITVVLKDNGGTSNGGKDSVTNTFTLAVVPVNDAPYFKGLTSKTILEDAIANNTMVVNAIDVDTENTNLTFSVAASDTNLVSVAITETNLVGTTNSALTLTFSPVTNANGSATITLVANDGAVSTTNSFLLTVSPVNDAPSFTLSTNLLIVAEDAGTITNENFLTDLRAGPDNETNQTWTFTVKSTGDFAFATAPTINPAGTLTFRAATNAVGTNVLTVVMKDNGGTTGGGRDSVTNTFSIVISAENDAPYFTGISAKSILEDATSNNTAVINVIDADTPNTSVSVTATSSDTNLVTVAITATNLIGATNSALTLTFTPQTNAVGSATITLVADDGTAKTTNSFVLTVTPVNDQPSFAVSTNLVLVAEDAGIITNLNFLTDISTGPTNEANQTWTFTVKSAGDFAFATAPTITTNGTLTFRAATNAVGTNLITVVMKDNGGTTGGGKDSFTNTFSIGITPVNDAPYFAPIATKTILEDVLTNTTVVTVIDVDTDSSNFALTATSSDTNLVNVALTATNLVSATNGAFTLAFTPQTNAYGSATITLVATDGALNTTNSFTLNITPVNDQPSFAVSTNLVLVAEDAGTITNLNFLTDISTGPTNEANQTWTFTVKSEANFAYATAPAISTNGTLTFRTATNAVGTNLITVVMKDNGGTTGGGRDSFTNTFSIGITPVNDAPYLVGVASKTILEDSTTNTMVVTVIDTDTLSSNLVLTATSSDTNLATVGILATNVVSATNAAFTLGFTPQTNAFGSLSVTLVATDGALSSTNSFLLTISPVNDQPTFTLSTNLVVVTEDAGTITNVNFLTDISPGPTNENNQKWTFTVKSEANFAYATAPAISTNGTLTFRTATNAVGTNVVTVVMKDSGGVTGGGKDSITNTFSIVVEATNDAPYFTGLASKTILEDATTNNTMVITVNDTDTASTNLAVTATSSDTNLVAVAITETNIVSATQARLTLTFTPQTNAFGSAMITVVANDGAASTTNGFLLTVSGVNDAPSFALSTNLVLVAEDAGTITNLNFLTDISTGPTNESNQKWTFTVKSEANFAYATAPAISTNGTLTFRAATNAVGTNLVTVIMKDSGGTTGGGKDSVTNTFEIGITPVNDAPYFAGLAAKTILEDSAESTAVVNVIDTDTPNSSVVVTVASSDTNLVNVAIIATNSIGTTNSALTLGITPVTNANGVATITLIADDGALKATNSFKLTVTPVNDLPSFTLSTNLVLVAEDAGVITNLNFLTDLSAGPTNENSQRWTFTLKSGTNFAFATPPTISTNGTLTFRAATNAVGTNVITVVMKDTGGTSNGGKDSVTNTFEIGITPVNDAPYFAKLTSKTIQEDVLTNTMVIHVTDIDTASSNLVVTATSSDTNIATVAVVETNILNAANAAYTLAFTPQTNAFGSLSVTLVANDGELSTTNSFLLTVSPVNDAPSFTLSTNLLVVPEDAGFVTNVNFLTEISAGPTNEASQKWTFTVTSGTNFGYALKPTITTNGTLIFKTATNVVGTNLITVVMKDTGGVTGGGQNSVTNTFELAVIPQNDAPTFLGLLSRTIREDTTSSNSVVVNVLDSDTPITDVVVSAISSDTNIADVAITATNIVSANNAALTLTFLPKTNMFGSLSITLVANDGEQAATNSFLLTVSSVNDAPSFTLSTNLIVIEEDAGAITNLNFLTNLSAGPTNESNQKWTFSLKAGTNFAFAKAPAISTNGTLTFQTATNAVGTNTITVIMKDNGGVANGGVDSVTNTFDIVVTPVNDAPYFTGLATKTILEDPTTNVTSIIRWVDVDTASSNISLTVSISDTNLATVAITETNLLSGTNGQWTLTYDVKTNANGSATVTLIADDGELSTTNSFLFNVTPVNDAPSFNLAISSLTVDKFNVPVTVENAVTNIDKGAFNETNQIISFVMSNSNPSLFTAQPAINANGTLTFTPAARGGTVTVTVRAKDNGGKTNGGQDTADGQSFTITIPPNPFAALGGTYAGLFFETNTIANDSAGYFRLVLATNGAFTGHILHAGSSNTFSGQFSPANPTLSLEVPNSSCVLDLTLDTGANWTETISGTVSNSVAGWSAQLLSFLNVNASGFPASLAGEYLVAIPGNSDPDAGPSGDSTLSVVIANNGVVTISGYLADDTFVKQTTQISRNGNVPFYVGLGANGSVSGWLTFLSSGNSHLSNDSEVVWIRGAGGALYPAGFTNAAVALGSRYNDTALNLLTMNSGTVELSGGGLSAPIATSFTLDNNVITIDPSATNNLKLTIFRVSGQIEGTFKIGSQTAEITSVILQSTNVARGYFVTPGGVGRFILY